MHFIRQYPKAKHVFTGGSGSLRQQQHKHSLVAKKMLQEQGLDSSKVIFEEQSRNTYENAKLSYAMVKPEPGENWILITTAWHMPRAIGVFNNTGWPVIAYPVDHYTNPDQLLRLNFSFSGNLSTLNIAIKEWVGLAAYWLTGKLSTNSEA
jgi:uncharacterized SAM-binding protein YcdF (DUF218 family)